MPLNRETKSEVYVFLCDYYAICTLMPFLFFQYMFSQVWLMCCRIKTTSSFWFLQITGVHSVSGFSENVYVVDYFTWLLQFFSDGTICLNIFCRCTMFRNYLNDIFRGWFGCWVGNISSFDFDLTRNPVEYDGFSCVHDLDFLQKLDNHKVLQFF